MDVLLNTLTNDRIFVNGQPSITSDLTTTVAQRLKIMLQTFLGEWFLDPTIGIDYFNQIFGKGRKLSAIDLIFQSAILL